MIVRASHAIRLLSRSLSGYLCGTHSGALAHRRGNRLLPSAIASMHRAMEASGLIDSSVLGGRPWEPPPPSGQLQRELASALAHTGVVELVVIGSQGRGSVTGFSDVDAVLIVDDAAAEDPKALRALRLRVLAAQRSVLAYQPMQHHGFEVVTPKLLSCADEALALPIEAFEFSGSLGGRPVPARFTGGLEPTRPRLHELVVSVSAVARWPRHPWALHRLVSMFELLPTLYLQARGRMVPKWRSFEEAETEFGHLWWPYEVLAEVRRLWPRQRRRVLEHAGAGVRNPWAAVAVWNRMPSAWPDEVEPLLTERCLRELRGLAGRMAESVG